jgi:hypothetical protein
MLKQENYLQLFINNLELILREYNLNDLKETLRLGDGEKIEKIRENLARMMCEECEIEWNDICLKTRRGGNKIDNIVADIYTLSHFFLDKHYSEQLNEIVCLKVKPFDYFREKNRNKFLIEKIYSCIPSNKSTNTSGTGEMGDEDKFQQIINSLSTMNANIQNIAQTQIKMQEQISKNSEDLEKVKEDVINLTVSGTDSSMRETSRGNKRKCVEVDKSINNNNKSQDIKDESNNKLKENKIKKPNFSEIVIAMKKDGNQMFKKKTKVIGNGLNQDVKAAERNFEVFVNNVDMKDSIENVVKMFNKNNIQVINCVEYSKRIKKSKAFVVNIRASDKDKVYNPQLWPKDVVLSKFSYYVENKGKYNQINIHSTRTLNSTFIDE